MKAVNRVFQYLFQTKNLALCTSIYGNDLDIENVNHTRSTAEDEWAFYSDSDHAGNSEAQNHRRSQNGMISLLNGLPVCWQSKASSVAFATPRIGEAHADISSAAAEIYAASNATMDLLGLSYAMEEMGLTFPFPIILQIDNDACKVFMNNSAGKTKLKHIDCRQDWVRTLRNKDIVRATHVDTADNLADIFTKILEKQIFKRLRDRIFKKLKTV